MWQSNHDLRLVVTKICYGLKIGLLQDQWGIHNNQIGLRQNAWKKTHRWTNLRLYLNITHPITCDLCQEYIRKAYLVFLSVAGNPINRISTFINSDIIMVIDL